MINSSHLIYSNNTLHNVLFKRCSSEPDISKLSFGHVSIEKIKIEFSSEEKGVKIRSEKNRVQGQIEGRNYEKPSTNERNNEKPSTNDTKKEKPSRNDTKKTNDRYYQNEDYKRTETTCYHCNKIYSGVRIVRHYLSQHPTSDVANSRFSPETTEKAIQDGITVPVQKLLYSGTKNPILYCKFCNDFFTKMTDLVDHITIHTGEYRHQCSYCAYKINNEKYLSKHYKDKHPKEYSEYGIKYRKLIHSPSIYEPFKGYMCAYCKYVQINFEHIQKHIKNNHTRDEKVDIYTINFIGYNYDIKKQQTSKKASKERIVNKRNNEQVSNDTLTHKKLKLKQQQEDIYSSMFKNNNCTVTSNKHDMI